MLARPIGRDWGARGGARRRCGRGVATDVAVIGGVGEFADADAIEDEPDDAVEEGHLTSLGESRET